MSEKPIGPFTGKYRFLSNFYICNVTLGGRTYCCSEIPYQFVKFPKGSQARKEIQNCSGPGESKKLARKYKSLTVPDYHDKKLGYMLTIVRAKFTQNPELKDLLLATGDRELIEYNTWNDTFWGVCQRTGHGQNHLGKILMQVRQELRNS